LTDWKLTLADVDIGEEEIEAVVRVMRSRWLTMGPRTEEFERAFGRHHGLGHAIAVSSGTAALHLACIALGVSPSDEVVMPALTFVATANASAVCGARPVFADIVGLDEPTIDPAHVASLITRRTRAIMVVHYAGYGCRMTELEEIARRHGIALIEDCAHAPGVLDGQRYLGAWGNIGCFSFFSNKNVSSGEGGMAVTDDAVVAERIRRLRSHGMTSGTWKRHHDRPQDYDVLEPGWNYRTDEVRSAIGLVQLQKLSRFNQRRMELTQLYRGLLEDVPRVRLPFHQHRGPTAAHILPLLAEDAEVRKAIVSALSEEGIQTSHHFLPVHLFKHYREKFGYREGMLCKTELFAEREITLPLHTRMGNADVEYVAAIIRNAVQNVARGPQ
jgi:dTDP-4-amino-4,6-dideoxygalactose transaminase